MTNEHQEPRQRTLLEGTRVYLSGPMDFVASRREEMKYGWRTRVGAFLRARGCIVFDPWQKPAVRGLQEYGREGLDTARTRKAWTFEDSRAGAKERAKLTDKFWETAELGWPVYEWCYRETLEPHGWLIEDQVTRKRGELSRTMWETEYELQEPSAEGRAIAPAAVERMFDADRGTHIPAGDLEHTWRGQPGPPAERAWPDPAGAWYCIGIDWAQKRHYTVAAVVRCDTTPLQVVAVYRIQRRPWPEMTERVGALLDEFPGPAVHDATGAGSAIGEFPALAPHDQLQGVTMVGRDRVDLFRNYIAAIERDEIVCPRIDVFYTEHLYCGEDELFGSGHPPDTVVAMALAYHAFKTGRRPGDYGVTL